MSVEKSIRLRLRLRLRENCEIRGRQLRIKNEAKQKQF